MSPEGEPLESAIREFLTTLSQGPLSSPVRLTIMLTLVLKGHSTFSDLQSLLGLTPGNLGSHLEKLEREDYVERLRCLRGAQVRDVLQANSAGLSRSRESPQVSV